VKIDSHHHFWNYNPVEYDWIDESMKKIRKDFTPKDLQQEISKLNLDGVVSVQARQSLIETEWLLELAIKNEYIKGVVGWVDLISANTEAELEKLAKNHKLKSIRHVLQNEVDDNFILRSDFNRGISTLSKFGLTYDILIFERHLPQTIKFVDAHPNQLFVLNHIAKPRIRDGIFEPWQSNIFELAKRPNVYCKISGLVTEAEWSNWTQIQLKRYFDTALQAFTPNRLMYGSDWPVCLVACDYHKWHRLVSNWIAELTTNEQASILGGTATQVYNL
jgi:L-fuconolactonase